MRNIPRLKTKYQKKVVPALQKEFGIKNPLAVPKVLKVVINVGIGEKGKDRQVLENAIETLKLVTGQKPLLTCAKKSIVEFKVRKGDVIGLKVTLRGKRMYYFLDKLFTIVLPRLRDFQGLRRVIDKNANYTLGLQEQTIFPEVDYDKIDRLQGLEITFVTDTKDKKQTERLLELLGTPFEKNIKYQK